MPFTVESLKGISYAQFSAVSGAYVAQYGTDTTAPTVSGVTPLAGATGVATSTNVTATFSEALNAATLTNTTFTLRASGAGSDVLAVVSYANGAATLTPSAILTPNTQYTAKLKGGAGGVSDVAGNPLAADYSWSFTTSAILCPCRIWANTASPASAPVTDGQSIEVGTKFRADTAGYITSLRYYKGAGDTDTHVGHLWASTGGAPLATVTFTGGTA